MSFENKRIWITGASSGIGEQLAYAFAARKAHLILSSRNVPELEKVKANCQGAASVMIYPIDLADHEGVAGIAKRVLERYGKIDILLHNGGLSQRALVKETKLSVDKYLMDVNYFGAVALTKAVLPSMITHQLGHIVVISSVMGKVGTPRRAAYAAAKHALHVVRRPRQPVDRVLEYAGHRIVVLGRDDQQSVRGGNLVFERLHGLGKPKRGLLVGIVKGDAANALNLEFGPGGSELFRGAQ